MPKYFCSVEQIQLLRKALLLMSRDTRSAIVNEVDNALDKCEKINYPRYDELIKVMKTANELYKILGKADIRNDSAVVIEHNALETEKELQPKESEE